MHQPALPEFRSRTGPFRVDILRDWPEAAARWRWRGQATVFQHRHWLDAWYGSFHPAPPLIAIIVDAATGEDLALLPLVIHERHRVRSLEFADLGLSDYNAPLLAPQTAGDPARSRAMSAALFSALADLPEWIDVIRFDKMPVEIEAAPNPLAGDDRAVPCPVSGNLVVFSDDYDNYRTSIAKLQLPRRWRVFERHPGAHFAIATEAGEAMRILDAMDRQQRKRMDEIGETFVLDEPRHAKFYRDVVRAGIADGYAVVSALTCGEEVVATTFGLRHGTHYSLLRNTNAGEAWSNCSPSQICIERTMAALHEAGVRYYDFSIGSYDYKRRFGAVAVPLIDLRIALSWRGLPTVLLSKAEREIDRHPKIAKRARRAVGAFAAVGRRLTR
jgi:CelD/BcsL family acetyltransferase involved in cellulose biosynthesis